MGWNSVPGRQPRYKIGKAGWDDRTGIVDQDDEACEHRQEWEEMVEWDCNGALG